MRWSLTVLNIAAISAITSAFLWWPLNVKKQHWLHRAMPLSITVEENYRTAYDFIVVGGGTAGSVIASRLAELRQWSILLIEAGDERNDENTSWHLTTEPQENVCLGASRKRYEIPAGKGLGGNTLVNSMVYARGNPTDYDSWARLGNTDWAYRNVLPYFLKLEDTRMHASGTSREQRGKGGPVSVTELKDKSALVNSFVAACNRHGLRTVDYNAEGNQTVGYVQLTRRRGKRVTSFDAYVQPKRTILSNLHIMTGARVLKVLLDSRSKQAIGVTVLVKGTRRQIRTNKEVILSAGPIFTPHLLMLSGIGPKAQLDALGIPVHQDLPVGASMQLRMAAFPLHLSTNRTPPQSSQTVLEAVAFINTPRQANHSNPSHEILFQYEPKGTLESFSIGLIHLQPVSRGFLKLNSTNPLQSPLIYGNFFSNPNDMEDIVSGIKECNKILQSPELAKFGLKPKKFKVSPCDQLQYSTDDYWRCVVRYVGLVADQPYGTCPMGKRKDEGSVVTPELKVHGIDHLRIVDASVMLPVSNGHTQATVYMIAEKASDLIKSHWDWGNELERRR